MTLSRRSWFQLVGGVVQPDSGTAQGGAADPLQRPDWVGGTRRVVGDLQNDPVVVGVERRLRCTCPCGLDIFTCRTTDFTCTYSPALHDEVVALVQDGNRADEVVAAFVAKYGEQILLAPKATGFGVLGYVVPSAAILGIGGLLAWVLVRRSQRMRVAAAVPVPVQAPAPRATTAAARDRVERALEDLET